MLSGDIRDNISRLNEIMNHSSDLKSREFNMAGSSRRAAILFVSTLANEDMIQEHILKPLIMESAVFNTRGSMDLNDIRNSMPECRTASKIVESF